MYIKSALFYDDFIIFWRIFPFLKAHYLYNSEDEAKRT